MTEPTDATRPSDRELLFQPTLSIDGMITSDTVTFAQGRLEDISANGKPLIVGITPMLAMPMRLAGSRSK